MKINMLMLKRGPVCFRVNGNINSNCFDMVEQTLDIHFKSPTYVIRISTDKINVGDVITILVPPVGIHGVAKSAPLNDVSYMWARFYYNPFGNDRYPGAIYMNISNLSDYYKSCDNIVLDKTGTITITIDKKFYDSCVSGYFEIVISDDYI